MDKETALIADDVDKGTKRWCPHCKCVGSQVYEGEDGRESWADKS